MTVFSSHLLTQVARIFGTEVDKLDEVSINFGAVVMDKLFLLVISNCLVLQRSMGIFPLPVPLCPIFDKT